MTDDEMAKEYAKLNARQYKHNDGIGFCTSEEEVEKAFLAGLKAVRPKWHKIFEDKPPYSYEYYDLPQDRLPNIENFYFVKLKNGFIKICELKYDSWSRKKKFHDLHGGTQSNVAKWLDYPTCDKE